MSTQPIRTDARPTTPARRSRRTVGTATVALALALGLAGCADGATTGVAASTTSAAPSATSPAPTTSPTTSPTASPAPTSATPSAQGQVVEISVAGGSVTGPKGRVKVDRGSTVTLRVTSDVADEVHLHGYDKSVDVEKGGTATLTFTAGVAGVFEVELEGERLQLVQLQVQ
ncbi:MAG: hypothetical protein ACKVZ6_09535 [Kineosporiaceae bacterium]